MQIPSSQKAEEYEQALNLSYRGYIKNNNNLKNSLDFILISLRRSVEAACKEGSPILIRQKKCK